MVDHALDAHDQLKKYNISARIIDLHTIKPIDVPLILQCVQETNGIITIEEHSIIGGLGSAIAEILADKNLQIPFMRMGINDRFCESGDPKELLRKYGLTADDIVSHAKSMLKK
jgi:transketolase